MRELRLAVGDMKGRRSTVWWITSTKADVYVGSRMMGDSTKVSLHGDGRSQFSLNSGYFARTRPGQPNRNRHIHKWVRPEPGEKAAEFVYRIVIPESELARIALAEDLTKVMWLPAPAVGHHSVIGLFLSPRAPSEAPISRPDYVGAIDVDHGRSIVVLHAHEEHKLHDRRQVHRLRTAAAMAAFESGQPLEPGFRGIGHFGSEDSVPGMVEFLPLPPAP